MRSIAFSTHVPMAAGINSSFVGKATAPKTTNGSPDASLKIAKPSIVGTNLAVTGQALHNTFRPGFNFSPRFNGRTTHLVLLLLKDIYFFRPGGCKPTAILRHSYLI